MIEHGGTMKQEKWPVEATFILDREGTPISPAVFRTKQEEWPRSGDIIEIKVGDRRGIYRTTHVDRAALRAEAELVYAE